MAELRIEEREGLGIATIMARKGVGADAIGARLGVALTSSARVASRDGLALVGTGPGVWLTTAEDAAPMLASDLAETLAGLASVSDQSGGYIVLRVAGEGARTLLQRGAAIDFHPDAFTPGSVATTVIAHIGVIIWQVDASPTYEVAVFRSYAQSFRHWLDATAATL